MDNATIDAFLLELITLYRKYGLSIGHEDFQGAFKIERLDDVNIKWIMEAERPALYY